MSIESFVDLFLRSPMLNLIAGFGLIPVAVTGAKALGIYAIVNEGETLVYTLFGKVLGTLTRPGLNFPMMTLGPRALLVPWFGKKSPVSTKVKQHYLRNLHVNSAEGSPIGVGVWYEMQVSDPEEYLFRNTDPEGSLAANVATSTISTLSNLEIDAMLENRHTLSRKVRDLVTPQSSKWGYKLGSVYLRKVRFQDPNMVNDISEKVRKRLIQVTAAMRQEGDNRIGVIRSETALKVSKRMAEAEATRPRVIGEALNEIANDDPLIVNAVLDVMETRALLKSGAEVEVVPVGSEMLVGVP